jgi:hypothetical protein
MFMAWAWRVAKQLLFLPTLIAVTVLGTVSLSGTAQTKGDATSQEYKVYEAVLGLMDQIPKQDPHVTIFNVTLNSQCGEAASLLPLANGCTFLWMKPDTAKSVKHLLSSQWVDLDVSTWPDFETKNDSSVRLHEPLSTPWKHKLVGPGEEQTSKEWDSPDLTIFLSRVGFNAKKTEAVVYVLTFSYMDQVETGGDYFLFRFDKTGQWVPNGRVRYFTQGKD